MAGLNRWVLEQQTRWDAEVDSLGHGDGFIGLGGVWVDSSGRGVGLIGTWTWTCWPVGR